MSEVSHQLGTEQLTPVNTMLPDPTSLVQLPDAPSAGAAEGDAPNGSAPAREPHPG